MIINGLSHKAIKHFRDKPAALAVYWIYCSRTNNEGVAWPSIRGLADSTGWSKQAVSEGRQWLVEHGALEPVTNYTRPSWRALPDAERNKKQGLNHSEYYRVTGGLTVDGDYFALLYFPGSVPAPDVEAVDVLPGRTPTPQDAYAIGRLRGRTELGISPELDSNSELDTTIIDDGDDGGAETPNIFTLYHETFGALVSSPMLAEEFKDIAATYPAAWWPDAFKAAALAGTRHPNYIRAVLEGRRNPKPKPAPQAAAPRGAAANRAAPPLPVLPSAPPPFARHAEGAD